VRTRSKGGRTPQASPRGRQRSRPNLALRACIRLRALGLKGLGLAVAACGGAGPTSPEPATIEVVVDGLPPGSSGTGLSLQNQGSVFLIPTGSPETVPVGTYSLAAASATAVDPDHNELLYACTPDPAQLTLVQGAHLTVHIHCEISSRAGLFVTIEGNTGGQPAAVERTEGEGVVVYPASTFDANVPPGAVVLTARPVTGNGITYRPTPDRIELSLSAGRVVRVSITYAP